MYVCICQGIPDRRLKEAIENGAHSFEALQACTGVATCCRTCEPVARELLAEALAPCSRTSQAA